MRLNITLLTVIMRSLLLNKSGGVDVERELLFVDGASALTRSIRIGVHSSGIFYSYYHPADVRVRI